MSFIKLMDLYSLNKSDVLFEHVESKELLLLANSIEKLRMEIQIKYDNDSHLLESLSLLKKVFFKLTSSLLPYNKVINKELEKAFLLHFFQIKKSYPILFSNNVEAIAKSIKNIIEEEKNSLFDYICGFINNRAKLGLKVAIVTKKAITVEERLLIQNELKSFLKVNYFTDNSFRKDIEIFDEVIFIGNPDYFSNYVRNTFKGKNIAFISYDIFNNLIIPKNVFDDLDNIGGVYSTIFENVSLGDSLPKKSNFTLERTEVLETAIGKFIEEQKNVLENSSHVAVEVCTIYLENDRFLFAPRDSKIRVFFPYENENLIRQVDFKDIEEDDYIVIRNERDTKLIAEVADQDILKSNAVNYRNIQNEWKKKLRSSVKKRGVRRVSEILIKRYNVNTASTASIRSWCNEESICPTELPKILKAFKYDEKRIEEIYDTMKEIQSAHRKAGRIISKKLMSELSNNIFKDLQERGYYTFNSNEFNGASFNIERIVYINRTKRLVEPYNLMKPMFIE